MLNDPPEYSKLLRPFRRALAKLSLDLEFFLEESGPIQVVSIEHRLKSFDSAIDKTSRLGVPIPELDDLAGFRIVAATKLDVQMLRHFFVHALPGTQFGLKKERRVDNEGYRAMHLVVEIPEAYTGTWSACHVEVQLQTMLEHAFNRLSRTWLYKSGRSLSPDLLERLQHFANELVQLDEQAATLQEELIKTGGNRDADQLTPLAYEEILREVLSERVVEGDSRWDTLYYRRCGIDTCGMLRDFFRRKDISQAYDIVSSRTSTGDALRYLSTSKRLFWQLVGVRLSRFQNEIDTLVSDATNRE